MKTFASKEKRSAPAVRKTRPYVHYPLWPVQQVQRAEIHRILRSSGAQAKLTIGQPNDKYEQEADRAADQVMAMPDPQLQRQPEDEVEEETVQTKPLADQITPLVQRQEEIPEEEEKPVQAKFNDGETIQRECPKCEEEQSLQRQPEEEEEEILQTKSKLGEAPAVTSSLESRISSLKGGGQPLDPATRSYFEPRFGRDFSSVRVHTDSNASETTKSVNARAFTLGSDMVFGSGDYQPQSKEGKHLLGHELTHVVQQQSAACALQRQDGDEPEPAPPRCPVEPISPIIDAAALEMEGGARIVWTDTAAGLQAAANALVGLIRGTGGTANITSAHRPQAYQDHLREVWDKARALRGHPEAVCDPVRAAVTAEMTNHALDVDRPVARISNHRAGNAVDIAWTLPAARTHADCQIPVPEGAAPPPPTEEECIDSLAVRAGLTHRLHARDRPHFEI
jgi:hypothetical protein